jgi:hypothetical protein
MQRQPETYVFAGPSLRDEPHLPRSDRSIALLPPAARGDVDRLVKGHAPAVVVVADGRFHQEMSVGHVELRGALNAGWGVWGVASIGAIRAHEMRSFGMHGFGQVYRMFARRHDFQDDEVALLHSERPPYRAGSEPLIHLRVALHKLVADASLTRPRALSVLRSLKRLWFGDRTLALFERLVLEAAPEGHHDAIKRTIRDFDRFRVKQKDLAALLATRPWRVSSERSC